jgi:SAM-dependent methyltransferase
MSNYLYPSYQEALNAPRDDIELCFCLSCTHLYNIRFDPGRPFYEQGYDNSLFYSSRYQSYAIGQARRLINAYALRGGKVIDIGCGGGEFLQLLHRLGGCTGTGYDPCLGSIGDIICTQSGLRFVSSPFPTGHPEPADLYVSRHVLEHLAEPARFLQNLSKEMRTGHSVLYLEIPNGENFLTSCSVWDILYEHCSIFTQRSVLYLLHKTGYVVERLQSEFARQYITLDARPAGSPFEQIPPECDQKGMEELQSLAEGFVNSAKKKMTSTESRIEEALRTGSRMIVWGAGSKGVSFLNRQERVTYIPYVIDINPQKKDKYIPGTGQKIVSPEFLVSYQPDIIFIVNEIYWNEIRERTVQLGISPQFICI